MPVIDYSKTAPSRVSQLPKEYRSTAKSFQLALTRASADYTPMEVIRIVAAVMGEAFATSPKPGIPTAMAMTRGIAAKQALKQSEGGSLSVEETSALLGITKTAVLKRYQKGQLLGWREARQNAVRFPVWQFSEDNVLGGLQEVLQVFQNAAWMDDWAKIVFFLGPVASLSGKRPLDLLRANEVSRAVETARALME